MSNMVVRTNVFALNSHRNLTNVGHMQRQSAQRLSSGFRVNSAADDAAGLAISETMRAQIRGLDQASINTQDGVGLIQTAEGAMATVSDMIIRMRELMVQAANDTNTLNNREMIQLEIDNLMTEINDVTFRTQFNTRTLLAGGLGGEGGGPSSPVSLQWMVFDQARVLGLPQSGGVVTRVPVPMARNDNIGRLPNVHYNPNNRTETGVRSTLIGLQNDLNDLARRVADRKVLDPNIDFTPDDLSQMFEEVRDLNFGALDMIPAERTELQSIANRIESELRLALRASEEMFQITQDQMNALGGAGAINADGSTVFSGPAIANWSEDARTHLEQIRAGFQDALDSLNLAMIGGPGQLDAAGEPVLDPEGNPILLGPLEEMNRAIRNIVGTIGGANTGFIAMFDDDGDLLLPMTHVANPNFNSNIPPNETTNREFLEVEYYLENIRGIDAADIDDELIAATATHRESTDEDFFLAAPGQDATHISNPNFVDGLIDPDNDNPMFLTVDEYLTQVRGIDAADITDADRASVNATHVSGVDEDGDATRFVRGTPATHVVDDSAPGGFRLAMPGETATHIRQTVANTRIAERPENNILSYMERLLDLSTDVLGNVNLESNAMWFQIGPNSLQGTVLQLKGIHTGILGGGRGDLAMLIDVRERSGIPISEQLDIIDIAEGIVNGQRAQLGAVQNRLEFTRQSLDISSENLSAAESRIRDTDMAREMMRFTAAQVLQQAGISMLAQANQLPASILQLLQ